MATKKDGLKDPFGKWDLEGDDSGRKMSAKDRKYAQDNGSIAGLQKMLSSTQKAQARIEKIAKAQASPGLSLTERVALKNAMKESTTALKEIRKTNKEIATDAHKSQQIERDAQRKLASLQAYRKAAPDADKATLSQIEKNLKSLIKNGGRVGTSKRADEKIDASLRAIDAATKKMPHDLQKEFEKRDKQTEQILLAQREARDYLKEQNGKMKSWFGSKAMGIANHLGVGAFSVGGAIRGARNVKSAYNSAKSGIGSVSNYIQARRVANDDGSANFSKQRSAAYKRLKMGNSSASVADSDSSSMSSASDTVGADEGSHPIGSPLSAIRRRGKGRKTKNDMSGVNRRGSDGEGVEQGGSSDLLGVVKDHAAESARFNRRALSLMGKATNASGAGSDSSDFVRKLSESLIAGAESLLGLKAAKNIGIPKTPPPIWAAAGGIGVAGLSAGILAGGAAASVFSASVTSNETARKAFTQDNDPYGMLSATSGDMGIAASIMNASEEGSKERAKKAATPVDGKSPGPTAIPVSIPQTTSSGGASSYDAMGNPTGGTGDTPVGSGGAAAGGGKISDFLGKIFSKSGGVDVDSLNPKMQSNIVAMGKEYNQMTGKKLNFNSAFRSNEEQAKLYKSKPRGMAAPPGSSLHNYGLAVDIPASQVNELKSTGLLSKYGFATPLANEAWHVQPMGMSLAAAKAGIYSGDAPADQGGSVGANATPSTPSVTSASDVTGPSNTNAGAMPRSGGPGGGGGSGGGGTQVSVSSVPTFDNSDGMFLALNTGIV